ncbi:MAG: POT family MFS transporter, partial [candidate division WOR-3 bacterium]
MAEKNHNILTLEAEKETIISPHVNTFPRSVYYIVGNEAAERFSYYGMRSILTLYMINILLMTEAQATQTIHIFMSAVYLMPLLGGWLADRYFGRYWTILVISLFYCLGHGILAITEGSLWGLYLGLALIAFGSGGIKPCVSAFVGDQFGPEREHLLPKVYGLFYWSINFGSFFAFLIIPELRKKFGYGIAFGVPGLAMALATFIFWLGTPYYVRKPPSKITGKASFWSIVIYALKRIKHRQKGQAWLDLALPAFSLEEVKAAKAVMYILLIFSAAPMFWALFDQTASTWVIQGREMRPYQLLGIEINAETIQSFNPLLVMIMIPLFTGLVYPLAERLGLRPTPLRRMTLGIALAGVSYIICAWIELRLERGEHLSIIWQTLPYIVLTAAEVLFSTTGLEFAFTQAPSTMKSIIMSFWLLTVTIGDMFVAYLTQVIDKMGFTGKPESFLTYAILCGIVAIIFGILAKVY